MCLKEDESAGRTSSVDGLEKRLTLGTCTSSKPCKSLKAAERVGKSKLSMS